MVMTQIVVGIKLWLWVNGAYDVNEVPRELY